MVFLCSRLKADCRNTYHLHTKTCFSLFDSFDFLRSGCFSFLVKGELAIFKTPSTCDVLNFALSFPVTITFVTGQYKMQTADCTLQTADRVQNAD